MKRKKYIFLILLIIGSAFIYVYGFTYAKYVSNSIWNYYLKSKGFYFNSDNLDSKAIKNVDNLWEGQSVHFNIRNNLNQTVVTNYDINYSVQCTVKGDAASYATCHMNGTNSNTEDGVLPNFQTCLNKTSDGVDVSSLNKTDCELRGYEWINQIASKDLYFDVVLTDDNYELTDVTVNVTATSTSPYHKTISGDFILHKINRDENNIITNYKNYSNYDRLIISNSYSSSKCLKVTWDSNKLLIDNNSFSSFNTDTNGYINEIKINIDSKDSLSYKFYKRNLNMIYDINEFTIEESSGC